MGGTKGTNIFTIVEETSDMTLFDSRWVPCSTRFVVAGTNTKGHGILRVYTMSHSDGLSQLVNIERKRHPFKCLTFGGSAFADRHPATGDFDGNINVWDLENKIPVWSANGHSSIINAIDGGGGKNTSSELPSQDLVTGSRDGSVKIWDTRTKDRPVACMQPIDGCVTHDCWTVAFGNSSTTNKIVAAGFDNGDVKLFDLRTMKLHWETHISTGVCSIAFDSSVAPMRSLAATCLQGFVHLWDLSSTGHIGASPHWSEKINKQSHTIWGGRYLHQNSDIFATIDGSGCVKIWKYNSSKELTQRNTDDNKISVPRSLEKLQESQLSEQPISSFDWSPDMLGLAVSTSFDQKVRILAFTNLDKL